VNQEEDTDDSHFFGLQPNASSFLLFSYWGSEKSRLNASPRLNWYRTRASAVRDRRLSAWVMAQAVSRRLLNVEVQLRSQFCLRCMVDKMTLRRFFSEYFGFPCQHHTTDASPHHIQFALAKKTNGRSLGKALPH
jgi:hypothetical protein